MNRNHQSVVLVLLIALTCATAALPHATADRADPLRETLLQKEKQGWDAIKNKNHVAWANLVAEDFVEGDALGIRGKVEEEKGIQSLADYAMSDIKILPLGLGRGMIIYKITLRGTYQGKDLPKTLYESSLYVKRGQKWLCLFSEDTEAE